ncbi:MAG: hypothetical protein IKM61_06265 [Eubacteriaceae bacterium]|nr:hypothetical protein [Eubacteriaceae bacterium]
MDYFTSMLSFRGQYIDCRMLKFEIDFYQCSWPELNAIATRIRHWLSEVIEHRAVLRWFYGDREIRSENIQTKIDNPDSGISFGFDGMIVSKEIYNQKSYKAFLKEAMYGSTYKLPPDADKTMNYKDVFMSYFQDIERNDEIKKSLLEIFDMSGMYPVSMWAGSDVSAFFHSNHYIEGAIKYCGKFDFAIALKSLGENVIHFSNEIIRFLKDFAIEFKNTSSRVNLSYFSILQHISPHMVYFGGRLNKNPEHPEFDYGDSDMNKYAYVPGAEWFNIISPLQQQLLPNLLSESQKYPEVTTEVLPGGNMIVRSSKDIISTDIDEYKAIKSLLYNALYPGKSEIKMKDLLNFDAWGWGTKPRFYWEYVPMFEDEIEVLDDRVIFRHRNNI